MHPSLIEKPFLTVADLHLIAKLLTWDCEDCLTVAEDERLDELTRVLDIYLQAAVSADWDLREALVA